MSTNEFLLKGGRVVTPDGVLEGMAVWGKGDRLLGVVPEDAPEPALAAVRDVAGAYIVPGFVDTHLHGGLTADTMDGDEASLEAISRHLAAHGVTAWLPTTVACPAPQLDVILSAVGRLKERDGSGAAVLGAHLESNFLAPQYKGAQPAQNLRLPDDPELLAVLERHRHVIRLVTLAPELPGALELIAQLRRWGIVVAVGHSDATYAQVMAAFEAGATRVTHLCNAQRPFHHREPGVVGAALATDGLMSEVIADLVHVHPAGLRIAYKCKGPGELMLVSDALRGTGLAPGTYELGGQTTHLDGRVARLADGTIAGSTITLERALANMVSAVGVPIHEAVAMASCAPAASLSLSDRGRLEAGCRADIALLDADFNCLGTMVGGRWVYERESREALR